jgi:hypothetical protein
MEEKGKEVNLSEIKQYQLNSEEDSWVEFLFFAEHGVESTNVSEIWYKQVFEKDMDSEVQIMNIEFQFRLEFCKVRAELLLEIYTDVRKLPNAGIGKFFRYLDNFQIDKALGMLNYKYPDQFQNLFFYFSDERKSRLIRGTLDNPRLHKYAGPKFSEILYTAIYYSQSEKYYSYYDLIRGECAFTFNRTPRALGLIQYYKYFGRSFRDYSKYCFDDNIK